ncbi:MAG: hypothetical protein SF052_14390 [Bacteroidia bacterium]|nr:hypothetical protein [Bacteroidia bacterium]
MEKSISTPQIIRWSARVWGILSIAFLLFMIGGHIFGDEPQNFNNNREIVSLIFFPGGILAGLILALKWEKVGGLIAGLSMVVFFIMAPNALGTVWFWVIVAPALLFLVHGFYFSRQVKVG